MGTATFVKRRDGMGEGRVYRLDPPLVEKDYDGREVAQYEYVWVSAISNTYATETYIFASDEDGEVQGWGELDGSFEGGCDHEKALRNAGYEVSA